ncbi:hypothetical protein [Kouleothrix sp.]|uniref:hypothetical protein n=1 Tax=Kouleothrix sp. TaxID=2779161 RepID=UPI00391BE127
MSERRARRARARAALASVAVLAPLLACATLGLALRADALAPTPLRVALGGYALDTTIENRICLQRALKRSCPAPAYTLRLSIEAPGGTRYYRLASVPISERYAFYP